MATVISSLPLDLVSWRFLHTSREKSFASLTPPRDGIGIKGDTRTSHEAPTDFVYRVFEDMFNDIVQDVRDYQV